MVIRIDLFTENIEFKLKNKTVISIVDYKVDFEIISNQKTLYLGEIFSYRINEQHEQERA